MLEHETQCNNQHVTKKFQQLSKRTIDNPRGPRTWYMRPSPTTSPCPYWRDLIRLTCRKSIGVLIFQSNDTNISKTLWPIVRRCWRFNRQLVTTPSYRIIPIRIVIRRRPLLTRSFLFIPRPLPAYPLELALGLWKNVFCFLFFFLI